MSNCTNHKNDIYEDEPKTKAKFSWIKTFPARRGVFKDKGCFVGKENPHCPVIVDIHNCVEEKDNVEETENKEKEDLWSLRTDVNRERFHY